MKMNVRRYICMMLLLVVCSTIQGRKHEPLRVTIFGDSYSTYENYLTPDTNRVWYFAPPRQQPNNDVSRVEQTWWWLVKEEMGWTIDCVNAYSGSTIGCLGYRGKDYTPNAFITRMNNLGDPDIILVCGATNDSWCDVPVGEYHYGEWSREELFTFRPAMAKLCWGLKTYYPKAKVLFILNTGLREDINESVLTVCAHYDIPVLCLHDIDKQDGHPSVAGMRTFADQVEAWARKNKLAR